MGSVGRVGTRRGVPWSVFVVLAAVMCLLSGPSHAFAAAKASDDGKDYGWLYRKGDYLCKEGDIPVCVQHGVDWYRADAQIGTNDWDVVRSYYADGTLYLHPYYERVLLDAVIRSKAIPSNASATDPNWARFGTGHSLPLFDCVDDAGRRVNVARIKRVVLDEDVAGMWGTHPYNNPYDGTYDLTSAFDGYRSMTELRGLQYLPTERISSMDRMFADCAQLEEFDLSAFNTSECKSFDKMFDGCVSMTSLTLGDGWTQAIPLAKREARIEALRSEAEAKRAEEEARKAEEEARKAQEEGASSEESVISDVADEGASVSDDAPEDHADALTDDASAGEGMSSDQGDDEASDDVSGDSAPQADQSTNQEGDGQSFESDDIATTPDQLSPEAGSGSDTAGTAEDVTETASMGDVYSDAGPTQSAAYDYSSRAASLHQASDRAEGDAEGNVAAGADQPTENGPAQDGDSNPADESYAEASDIDTALQEAIDEVLADTTGLATFPVDMYGTRGGETALYRAGEVVPDGAGTYVVAGRRHIKEADVRLSATGSAADAVPAGALTCEYTGGPVEPALFATDGGSALEAGVDYELEYADNVEEGTATVTITGRGSYYGCATATFEIADTGAYAFLYADGRLYLKAGHGLPSKSVVCSSARLTASFRWFDSATRAPGSSVPWSKFAAKIKSVAFDPSFRRFRPTSARAWFSGCASLTAVSGWENLDASSLTTMEAMFSGCTSLADLSLAGLSSAKVTSFADFANGCSGLETLNLGTVDAYNATDMRGFLTGCSKLKRLVTARGWRNARAASARLTMPVETYQTAPVYKLYKKGAAVPNGAGTYQFRDLALSFARVKMPASTYTCTGKAVRPRLTVTLGGLTLREGADYTVSYANNVQTGNAKATVKGRGVFSGGLVVPFKIKARTVRVGDRLTYTNGQATYTFVVTKPNNKAATTEAAIEVVNIKSVKLESLALPSQCTIGGVKVTLTSVSSKLRGNFRNVRTVIVGPSVTTIGAYAFKRTPKVRTVVLKTARIKHMGRCLKGSKVTLVQAKVSLSKTKQKNYRYWFTHYSYCGKSGVRFRYW